jgi:hypothetical protein
MAKWVIYEAITASGCMLAITVLPAIQASLPEEDAASSTATFAFVRSFGTVWGVTIPAAVFNNQFNRSSYLISDPAIRRLFTDGQAYSRGTKAFIKLFDVQTQGEIRGVYADALRVAWLVAVALNGLGFLIVWVEKEIELRKDLETEYGMEKRDMVKNGKVGGSGVV